ncbi:MAG TPA: HlyD family efflux transporter periplasmic adaptor subunit [Desulfitobacteriaceae bacterium]|jgi:HlyD family secretion protein|nr:HlyD family efflux transporter periplasmic adaptor subunit [Desulfitobacteriaceae bacterium]
MKKKIIALVGLVIIVGGLVWLGFRYQFWGTKQSLAYSGTIEATQLPVQAEQNAKITAVLVYEGQEISAGQVIAQLDNSQALIALDTAKGQVQQAEAKLNDLLGGTRSQEVRRLQAVVDQTSAGAQVIAQNIQYEEKNLADLNQLYAAGGISKKEVDAQQNKLDNLKAQYAASQKQVEAARASLDLALAGYTQPTIEAQKTAVEIARQAVKSAELALDKLEIKSPVNGRVLYKHVEPGQVVNAGARIVTLVDAADLTVKVYVPEAKLSSVKIGGAALISVDAYPDKTFQGEVQYISDKSEFTPKNVQTKEERTSMVFAVKIRINEGKDLLKAGMPADVAFQ